MLSPKRPLQRLWGLLQLAFAALALCWLFPNSVLGTAAQDQAIAWLLALPVAFVCGLSGWWLVRGESAAGGKTWRRYTIAFLAHAVTGLTLAGLAVAVGAGLWWFRADVGSGVALLLRPLRIHGIAADAQSGAAIPGLKITPGAPMGDQYAWAPSGVVAGEATVYAKVFRFPFLQVTRSSGELGDVVLQFSAPGYETVISSPFRQRGGTVVFDARLKKAARAEGVVRTPDGQPAAGAEVLLVSKHSPAWLQLTGVGQVNWRGERLKADAAGRFEFFRSAEDLRLLVVDARGFGFAESSAAGAAITLQPWARIEGEWLASGRPDGVTWMDYAHQVPGGLRISATPSFDAATGHFSVPRVPPGRFTISWQTPRVPNEPVSSYVLAAGETRAGETMKLECSTPHREVTGAISRSGSVAGLRMGDCQIILHPLHATQPPMPDDLVTTEAKNAWWAKWEQTDAGRAYEVESRKMRVFTVQADGRFSCRFVLPGKYYLSGSFRDGRRALGRITSREIEIPAGTEVFDVGVFTMQPTDSRFLAVGDSAPAFSVPGVAGGKVTLAAPPGKVVLVDFWATNCGPCVAEIPHLRRVYDRYRNDPRVQIISLDMDATAAHAQKFIEANRMEWSQGYLGYGQTQEVARDYGVQGIPAAFLIGPTGKILARDLRGSTVESAIADALRE